MQNDALLVLRLPRSLRDELASVAFAHERTVAAQARFALRKHLERVAAAERMPKGRA